MMLDRFIDYYGKAKMMQELKFQGKHWAAQDVNDDLVWNIPIYDVVNRRYAAFSSLLEALSLREYDPKGNGKYFNSSLLLDETNSGEMEFYEPIVKAMIPSTINTLIDVEKKKIKLNKRIKKCCFIC